MYTCCDAAVAAAAEDPIEAPIEARLVGTGLDAQKWVVSIFLQLFIVFILFFVMSCAPLMGLTVFTMFDNENFLF